MRLARSVVRTSSAPVSLPSFFSSALTAGETPLTCQLQLSAGAAGITVAPGRDAIAVDITSTRRADIAAAQGELELDAALLQVFVVCLRRKHVGCVRLGRGVGQGSGKEKAK